MQFIAVLLKTTKYAGKSTVCDIKKNEDKLKKFASGMKNFSVGTKSRKIMLNNLLLTLNYFHSK